jgi:hypothetical protein
MHCVPAVRQSLCHQELHTPRVPAVHHMDDRVALARREGILLEGASSCSLRFSWMLHPSDKAELPSPLPAKLLGFRNI